LANQAPPQLQHLKGLIDDSTQRMVEGSGVARRDSEVYHKDIQINPDPMKINVLFKNSTNKQSLMDYQALSENNSHSNVTKTSSP
jgi:hypothetical protein